MARLFRRQPDSSGLRVPRVFVRVFCDPGKLVETVRFYERLTSTTLDMDMDIPESGLHVVAVGPFLILEMDRDQLDRAGQAVETTVTVLNADLQDAVARSVAEGAEIVQERWEAPVGGGVRLRHPDGLLVEYVEHRPSPDDVSEPGEAFTHDAAQHERSRDERPRMESISRSREALPTGVGRAARG